MNDTTGRPKLYQGLLLAQSVRLTLCHVRAARRLGRGNLSEGVREAIERADNSEDKFIAKPKRAR